MREPMFPDQSGRSSTVFAERVGNHHIVVARDDEQNVFVPIVDGIEYDCSSTVLESAIENARGIIKTFEVRAEQPRLNATDMIG